MTRHPASGAIRWLLWVCGALLVVAGCSNLPGSAQVAASAPPVPSGQARVWFYRPWEPSESLNLAMLDMNGSYVGAVANGSAFYRDVQPGNYRIAPQSFVRDPNQERNVDIASGQQVYIKIVSLSSWGAGNSASKNFQRDAFWAWLIPPEVAQVEMGRDRSSI
jgi:hypothetical protein